MVFELASVEVKGDRLSGELLGTAAADWAVLGPEGTGTLDIRETLRTDDGATIFVQYHGRLDASQGLQFPMTIYVAPRFETGDERHAWLNRVQAVGKGILDEDLSLDYEWYGGTLTALVAGPPKTPNGDGCARLNGVAPAGPQGAGDSSGGHVRRDSSIGLIRPTSFPSGSATIAYRAPQKASNGGCRPA